MKKLEAQFLFFEEEEESSIRRDLASSLHPFVGRRQGSLMDPEEFRSNFGGGLIYFWRGGGRGGGGGGTNFRKSSVKRSLTRDDLSRKCEFTLEFRKRK